MAAENGASAESYHPFTGRRQSRVVDAPQLKIEIDSEEKTARM